MEQNNQVTSNQPLDQTKLQSDIPSSGQAKSETQDGKGKLPKLIIYLLIVLFLFIASFFGYTKYQRNLTKQLQPTPFSSPTVQPATTPTSSSQPESEIPDDWQTYKNEKYGFEFSYPDTIDVKEQSPKYISIMRSKEGIIDLAILLFVSENPERLSEIEFFAKSNNTNLDELLPHLNITQVSLGQTKALRIVEDADYFKLSSIPQRTIYLFAKDSIIYELRTSEYKGKFEGEKTEIIPIETDVMLINQILSTFRFLD